MLVVDAVCVVGGRARRIAGEGRTNCSVIKAGGGSQESQFAWQELLVDVTPLEGRVTPR